MMHFFSQYDHASVASSFAIRYIDLVFVLLHLQLAKETHFTNLILYRKISPEREKEGGGGDGGCSLLWREQKTIYFIISEIKWPDLNSMASGTLFVRQQILQHIVMIAMKSILNNDVIWAPIHTTQYQTSTSSVAKSDFYLLSMNHVYTTHSTWNSLIYFKCFSFIECSRFDVSQSDEKRQTFAGKRTVALFELNATNRRDEK